MSGKKRACSIFFPEPQPILSKDSARRVKNRASRVKNEVYFSFSEAQPVLSKSKTNLFENVFPNRSLSYQKIVQGERKMAFFCTYRYFLFEATRRRAKSVNSIL
uniref:hypothetical protein n=1 Tax=Candidatus Limisoma sp. TaxID=3076476 RepID=UPI004028963A